MILLLAALLCNYGLGNCLIDVGTEGPVARAYIRDSQFGDTVTKLARYQTSLERSYYRALHELERLRAPQQAGLQNDR